MGGRGPLAPNTVSSERPVERNRAFIIKMIRPDIYFSLGYGLVYLVVLT